MAYPKNSKNPTPLKLTLDKFRELFTRQRTVESLNEAKCLAKIFVETFKENAKEGSAYTQYFEKYVGAVSVGIIGNAMATFRDAGKNCLIPSVSECQQIIQSFENENHLVELNVNYSPEEKRQIIDALKNANVNTSSQLNQILKSGYNLNFAIEDITPLDVLAIKRTPPIDRHLQFSLLEILLDNGANPAITLKKNLTNKDDFCIKFFQLWLQGNSEEINRHLLKMHILFPRLLEFRIDPLQDALNKFDTAIENARLSTKQSLQRRKQNAKIFCETFLAESISGFTYSKNFPRYTKIYHHIDNSIKGELFLISSRFVTNGVIPPEAIYSRLIHDFIKRHGLADLDVTYTAELKNNIINSLLMGDESSLMQVAKLIEQNQNKDLNFCINTHTPLSALALSENPHLIEPKLRLAKLLLENGAEPLFIDEDSYLPKRFCPALSLLYNAWQQSDHTIFNYIERHYNISFELKACRHKRPPLLSVAKSNTVDNANSQLTDTLQWRSDGDAQGVLCKLGFIKARSTGGGKEKLSYTFNTADISTHIKMIARKLPPYHSIDNSPLGAYVISGKSLGEYISSKLKNFYKQFYNKQSGRLDNSDYDESDDENADMSVLEKFFIDKLFSDSSYQRIDKSVTGNVDCYAAAGVVPVASLNEPVQVGIHYSANSTSSTVEDSQKRPIYAEVITLYYNQQENQWVENHTKQHIIRNQGPLMLWGGKQSVCRIDNGITTTSNGPEVPPYFQPLICITIPYTLVPYVGEDVSRFGNPQATKERRSRGPYRSPAKTSNFTTLSAGAATSDGTQRTQHDYYPDGFYPVIKDAKVIFIDFTLTTVKNYEKDAAVMESCRAHLDRIYRDNLNQKYSNLVKLSGLATAFGISPFMLPTISAKDPQYQSLAPNIKLCAVFFTAFLNRYIFEQHETRNRRVWNEGFNWTCDYPYIIKIDLAGNLYFAEAGWQTKYKERENFIKINISDLVALISDRAPPGYEALNTQEAFSTFINRARRALGVATPRPESPPSMASAPPYRPTTPTAPPPSPPVPSAPPPSPPVPSAPPPSSPVPSAPPPRPKRPDSPPPIADI